MPTNEIMSKGEERMKKTVSSTQKEFSNIRTGRANPLILDKITVDYYGTATPVRQLSNVSVQDGQNLVITPYDKSSIANIEKAIMKSDIGITPNNDGTNIRLVFPQPTEERRKELVKDIKKQGEESKVAIRNIRREMSETLKKAEKTEHIPEDEIKKQQDDIQKLTDRYIKEIDNLIAEKEKEILSI
ncbi:MAG: ribosome recycling factor [Candidatus Melainabacteria bacterium GWF2_37_15]|nr:MAG: ribosome recycling factor [Candidatus Melainabacteria bacterium GWF2_37_15]